MSSPTTTHFEEPNQAAETVRLAVKWGIFNVLALGSLDRYFSYYSALVRAFSRAKAYERENLLFLETIVKPGDDAIDAGALFGAYTLALSSAVGPAGRVFSFEPLAPVHRYLAGLATELRNVETFNVALSDVSKTGEIYIPTIFGKVPEPCRASLTPPERPHERHEVRIARLDEYQDKFRKLSFIKADIEGHEIAFLRGGANVIRRFKPVIQLESWCLPAEELRPVLDELGYGVFVIAGKKLEAVALADINSHLNVYLAPQPA